MKYINLQFVLAERDTKNLLANNDLRKVNIIRFLIVMDSAVAQALWSSM